MKNPKINPPLTPTDVIIEGLATICLAYIVAQLIIEYPELNQKVPINFGGDGMPDSWGSKTALLIFPISAIVF